MHILLAGQTHRAGRSSREGGAPYGSGPSAPWAARGQQSPLARAGRSTGTRPRRKGRGPVEGGRSSPESAGGGGVRRGGSPGICGAFAQRPRWPCWERKKCAPRRRGKMEEVADEHLPPHALARSLAIPAPPSGSICPRRAEHVTPRGRLAASNRSAPTKNDHATTAKGGAGGNGLDKRARIQHPLPPVVAVATPRVELKRTVSRLGKAK
ncbi:uncharacterized protein Tco025E_08829 [Trypanosoma conorhini]|uniref:Uncharacterized protein n=1 Tax=Trypanosoma conorhini TaxID=83891 RepID=A0A3R7MCY1_9TRYP|nr:uncharacterized protein Tco025E_08829 [Trypanosoma conorhini]RNF00294.1 hypothetical protein Tco025E_08829 [Trypanosoma conorhini]